MQIVAQIVGSAHEIGMEVERMWATAALRPALADVREQVARLVHPGFVTATGVGRLGDVHRYLRAVQRRLESLPARPDRDRELMAQVHVVDAEYRAVLAGLPPGRRDEPAVRDIGWLVEELRVSLFAQTVGTAVPVSAKRIYRALDELAG
jgi:ATP-dependent helicase HrpA